MKTKHNRRLLQEFNAANWEDIKTNPFYKPQIDAIRAEADRLICEPIPSVSFADYHLYYETGNRLQYENFYFERRKRLDIYAFLYLLDENDTYRKPLFDSLWAILDEFTWALPAHVDENLPLEKQRCMLDLFSSETGYTLSEIYFLLHHRFPKLLCRRIEAEIHQRIIQSFLVLFPNGMNRWEAMNNNWAAVCAGSVGNVFLYMASDEEWAAAKPRLLTCMNNFLSGFSNDGACLEGFTYWQYGFGYFLQFAELLRQYTDGAEDLLTLPKVQLIAQFQQNCILDDSLCIPVSDANMEQFKQDLYISHYLYRHFPGIELPDREMSYRFGDDHCHRWGAFLRYFLWTDSTIPVCTMKKKSWYFKDAAWYIHNDDMYSFMAKAGHNDEPHNHNDIGNFCLSHQNHFLLYDLGAGEYTASYFRDETRYSHITNSSFGHSVPLIGGAGQMPGKQYSGSILEATHKHLVISMEHAYDVSALKILIREFTFRKNSLLLTDTYEFAASCEIPEIAERFITKIKPSVAENSVCIDALSIVFDSALLTPSIQEKTYTGHHNTEETVYLVDFTFTPSAAKTAVSFELKLSQK